MTLEEWNKAVDDWVVRENKRIGQVCKPSVGMYPPRQKGLTVSEMGINNRMATADLIRHYADAIGDVNPLWRSEDYAKNTRYGRIIAPPKFIDCIAPTSGMGMGFPDFGVEGLNPLNSGSKVTYFQTIYAGDEFTVQDRFLGVREVTKKDRPMPRLFVFRGSRTYLNQRQEVVAIAEGGAIVVGSGPDRHGNDPAFAGIKRRKYTPEELAEVERAYDEEEMRGNEPLYWEDVAAGDPLPVLTKGPLTIMESVAFFHVIGYTVAFKVKNLLIRENPGWQVVDPETNVPTPVSMIHVSDENARAQGVPYAVGFATQLEGNIVHSITNWMGDDGFLQKMECQARRVYALGDMCRIKGSVTRKYVEDGEHLVDLKLSAENQDGAVLMPVVATVRLPARSQS